MSLPDVVITGLGAVTPSGVGCGPLWDDVSQGRNAIRWITCLDAAGMPVRYAGEVPDCDAEKLLKRPPGLRRDRGLQFGLVAAQEALAQARLLDDQDRLAGDMPVGTIVGTGLGPCFEAEYGYGCFFQKGWKSVRPMTVPKSMHNALSSHVSIYFGLTGGSHTIAGACASGALAIGQAWAAIRAGQEDIVLCGGADSPLTPAMFAAWTGLRVLAQNEDPAKASRPFDKGRKGLVIAEGAAMMVLESAASAQRRGVPVLGRVTGCGLSSDAFDLTAPSIPGQMMAMRRCLASAGRTPDDVDHINAHGTATQANDAAEAAGIVELFGARGTSLPVSSTKSVIGHSLGASGAIEAVVCVEALRQQFVPPTRNTDEPDPDIGLDYVPHVGRAAPLKCVLSNSFAFGGSNCSLLFER
jgi:3-oxoacyl-[acyl-carrier-protein] synthase II